MGKNYRDYSRSDDEEQRDTIKKLKSLIKSLYKEIDILKSENKTLLDAWAKTEHFLVDATNGVPLEKLLKMKKLPKNLVEKKNKKIRKEDTKDKEQQRQEAIEKWQKWRKENLK